MWEVTPAARRGTAGTQNSGRAGSLCALGRRLSLSELLLSRLPRALLPRPGCVWLKRGDPPTPSAPSVAPAPPVRLSAPALSGAEGHKEGDPVLAERRGFVTTTPGLSAVSGQRDRVKEPCVNIQLVACPRSHVRPGRGPDLCVSVAFRSGWRSRPGNTP